VKEIAGMKEGASVGVEEGASVEVQRCHRPVAECSPGHGPRCDTIAGLAHNS
jgi:hypothetical protein